MRLFRSWIRRDPSRISGAPDRTEPARRDKRVPRGVAALLRAGWPRRDRQRLLDLRPGAYTLGGELQRQQGWPCRLHRGPALRARLALWYPGLWGVPGLRRYAHLPELGQLHRPRAAARASGRPPERVAEQMSAWHCDRVGRCVYVRCTHRRSCTRSRLTRPDAWRQGWGGASCSVRGLRRTPPTAACSRRCRQNRKSAAAGGCQSGGGPSAPWPSLLLSLECRQCSSLVPAKLSA
jgi:hypothetical protein